MKKILLILFIGCIFQCKAQHKELSISENEKELLEFLTKITFEKEFIGNLQQGKSEREEQQKIEKQHRIDKWVKEEQQKMWRSPKF